jgi:hypothetical protein
MTKFFDRDDLFPMHCLRLAIRIFNFGVVSTFPSGSLADFWNIYNTTVFVDDQTGYSPGRNEFSRSTSRAIS